MHNIKIYIFLLTLWAVLASSGTGLVQAREFILNSSRGPIEFEQVRDRLALGWGPGRDAARLARRLDGLKNLGRPPLDRVLPGPGVSLLRLRNYLTDGEYDEMVETLLLLPDLQSITPLLYLPPQQYLPSTEVQFLLTSDQANVEPLAALGLSNFRPAGPRRWTARFPREIALDLIALCNQVSALPEVVWCEPLWLEGRQINGIDPASGDLQLTIQVNQSDVRLVWQDCGADFYEIWSGSGALESALHREAVVRATEYVDRGVLRASLSKYYLVRALRLDANTMPKGDQDE